MSVKHALLILLEREGGSGYDLAARFNRGIGQFWQASHQQIYQQLKTLSRDAWVEFERQAQQGKPDRKLYRITDAGRLALQDWLASESKLASIRDALLIKIFAAQLADRAEIEQEVERHLEQHKALLEQHRAQEREYFQLEPEKQRKLRWPYLTLRRGIRFEQEWVDWLQEVQALLQDEDAQLQPIA